MQYSDTSYESLQWRLMWAMAFPTILASLIVDMDSTLLAVAWNVWSRRVKHFYTVSSESLLQPCPRQDTWSRSLGYGELIPSSVWQILGWIHGIENLSPCCMADLGSGTGNLLRAAVMAESNTVHRAIGIEIVRRLHNQATSTHKLWDEWHLSKSKTLWEWRCADFTIDTSWIQADIVWIHATVFEDSLMQQLNQSCRQCREGTYFVMVSKPLQVNDGIVTLRTEQLDVDWGQGTVYLQRKLT